MKPKLSGPAKVDALWQHVTGVCGHKPSEMMSLVGQSLRESVAKVNGARSFGYLNPVRKMADRIANHETFQKDGTAFFEKVKCEWPICNGDLEMWAHLCLFGARDCFPGEWEFLTGGINSAIKKARVWQSYERYIAKGRLNDDHRKLLAGLIWDQDVFRGDWVGLHVEGKRPFGDSSRASNMAGILGWNWSNKEEEMPAEMVERAWELFDELRFAICDAIKGA